MDPFRNQGPKRMVIVETEVRIGLRRQPSARAEIEKPAFETADWTRLGSSA
jgi:hypothetical protein